MSTQKIDTPAIKNKHASKTCTIVIAASIVIAIQTRGVFLFTCTFVKYFDDGDFMVFEMPNIFLEPEISIIKTVFAVANRPIAESRTTTAFRLAFFVAAAKRPADMYSSFHPTKEIEDTDTKI